MSDDNETKKNNGTGGVPVRRGTMRAGLRYAFYGVESVGKTTLAAHARSPVFIDCEDGTGRLDVARYQFDDGAGGHVPSCLENVYGALRTLATAEHDFRTVVIDTMDRLEALIWAHVLERDSGKMSELNPKARKLDSIEAYGYGKGYQVALDEWRRVCAQLDGLRLKRGMDVILLGHAHVRTFKNPDGEDWDRYQLRVQDSERVSAAGFIKEWVDVLGFCVFEQGAGKLDTAQIKAKGWSTGRRFIKLERTAAYDAKSRIPLPAEVELSAGNPWGPFAAAVEAGLSADPESLKVSIGAELKRIGDETLKEKVTQAIKNVGGNAATLSLYLNELRRRQPQEQANV